ncbi:hypothetical protein C1645_47910 [Glomus cerebriforme]|uniref:Uncharacterized protein n=1 Tax=Glomus cerebriforme TaxID=658196 RepID=A0A397RZX0_9GLOM|nr:hypothetical protein C1645_47910 [Glomus cerebriforme]
MPPFFFFKRYTKMYEMYPHYPGRTVLLDYLEESDPSLWSYIDFLTLNRALIVKSLPHLDDQKGLDGAWTNRFLLAVEEMSPELADDIRRKVFFFSFSSAERSLLDRCYLRLDYQKFSDPSDGVRQLLDRCYLRLEHQKFSGSHHCEPLCFVQFCSLGCGIRNIYPNYLLYLTRWTWSIPTSTCLSFGRK